MNTMPTSNGSLHQADPIDLLIASVFPSEPPAATRAALEAALDRFRTSLDAHPYVRTLDKRRKIVRLTWRATIGLAAAAAVVAAIMVFRSMPEPVKMQVVVAVPSNPVMPHVTAPTLVIVTAASNEQWIVRGVVAYEDSTPVTGTLVWAEATPKPLKGRAQAYACNPAAALSGAVTWTDVTGSFAIAFAEGVTSVVVKTMPRGCMSIAECSLPATGQCVRLVASSKVGNFTGRFTGPDSIPVTNVTMWRWCRSILLQVSLDIAPDGRYTSAAIPSGDYKLKLVACGYAAVEAGVGGCDEHTTPMDEGECRTWDVQFELNSMLYGVVYDGITLKPLSGVTISMDNIDAYDPDDLAWSPKTDKDGAFWIRPMNEQLTFSYPGYSSEDVVIWRDESTRMFNVDAGRLVVFLSPGADLFVRVFDKSGKIATNCVDIVAYGQKVGGGTTPLQFHSLYNVTNGMCWLRNMPVHVAPMWLELEDRGLHRVVDKTESFSPLAGTMKEITLSYPPNKLLVRVQPPVADTFIHCAGDKAFFTRIGENQWMAETIWTGQELLVCADCPPIADAIAFIGWDETKCLDLQVRWPRTKTAEDKIGREQSPQTETNSVCGYHVRCRIADSRGNDMWANVQLMAFEGERGGKGEVGFKAKGYVDFFTAWHADQRERRGVPNGSYGLYLYPCGGMAGFLFTSVWFTVENNDVDLGTIVLDRGDVTVTGRFVDPQGMFRQMEFELTDETKGRGPSIGNKSMNFDGMFSQYGMKSSADGWFILKDLPANRRIHIVANNRTYDTWIGPFTTNTDLGTIVCRQGERRRVDEESILRRPRKSSSRLGRLEATRTQTDPAGRD